jgi:hypothetical protein
MMMVFSFGDGLFPQVFVPFRFAEMLFAEEVGAATCLEVTPAFWAGKAVTAVMFTDFRTKGDFRAEVALSLEVIRQTHHAIVIHHQKVDETKDFALIGNGISFYVGVKVARFVNAGKGALLG